MLIIGGSGYPLSNPLLFNSKPGGKLPCTFLINTGLAVTGLLYSICNSLHIVSFVVKIVPVGVVNVGIATPLIIILNVLSAICCSSPM